jgi:hypothetical protein
VPITHCIPAGSPWATNEIPCPGVHAQNVIQQPVSGSRRGRMIFFPSTGASAAQIQSVTAGQNLAGFASALIADSWEVVSVDNFVCQITNACSNTGLTATNPINLDTNGTGSNGGARLRASQAHYSDHIKLYVNQTYGYLPTFIAGYSWGGYAVLALAIDRPKDYIGIVSRCGPTIFQSVPLCSDWSAGTFTSYNIGATDLNTTTLPIHISYSSNDIAIGVTNINALTTLVSNAQGASAPVTSTEDGSDDHGWFTAETTDIMSWVTATLDPHYPAVL